MTGQTRWLVLFDIDGTLIKSGRAGVRGMNAAFARLYGAENALAGVPIAGRTDRAIVSEVMQRIGVEPTRHEIFRLREAYLADLAVEIRRPVPEPAGVLPGVTSLLDALAERADVTVGLLTGNFERGAAIKLGHFSLLSRFALGAFGDEHADRRELVPIALGRAADAGIDIANERVVIIGDTPLDVDCALAHGACAVGVATGHFDDAALHAAGAHVVVSTLAEQDAILQKLGSRVA